MVAKTEVLDWLFLEFYYAGSFDADAVAKHFDISKHDAEKILEDLFFAYRLERSIPWHSVASGDERRTGSYRYRLITG